MCLRHREHASPANVSGAQKRAHADHEVNCVCTVYSAAALSTYAGPMPEVLTVQPKAARIDLTHFRLCVISTALAISMDIFC